MDLRGGQTHGVIIRSVGRPAPALPSRAGSAAGFFRLVLASIERVSPLNPTVVADRNAERTEIFKLTWPALEFTEACGGKSGAVPSG